MRSTCGPWQRSSKFSESSSPVTYQESVSAPFGRAGGVVELVFVALGVELGAAGGEVEILPRERTIFVGDEPHLGLDPLEVVAGDGGVEGEVVVETGVQRRAVGEQRVGVQPQDRLGHDMRGGVAEQEQSVLLVGVVAPLGAASLVAARRGDDAERERLLGALRRGLGERAVGVGQHAGDAGADRGLGQARADAGGHRPRGGVGGGVNDRSVGELEARHGGTVPGDPVRSCLWALGELPRMGLGSA